MTGRAGRADRWTVAGGGGVPLAVTAVGDPRAPAVVVAHGAGSSARFVVEAFAGAVVGAGTRLVAYDLRGHGGSGAVRDVQRLRLEDHVADLAAVVAAAGARIVGGVSLGAHAAAAWAATTPGSADGLLLCMPAWTGVAARGVGPHAWVAGEVRSRGVEAVLAAAEDDPAVPRWLAGLLRRDWTRHDRDSLAAALMALDGARAPDVDELRTIDVPAGVVGWPDDAGHPLDVARTWAAELPRAALAVTSLREVGEDPGTLGRAALAALEEARGR